MTKATDASGDASTNIIPKYINQFCLTRVQGTVKQTYFYKSLAIIESNNNQ